MHGCRVLGRVALDIVEGMGRALAVLRALELPPELLERTALLAFASNQPLKSNRDANGHPIAANQALNRRVTLRIY